MYKLVTTPLQLDTMINSITQVGRVLSSDTETTGLDPKTSKLRLIQVYDGFDVYLVDCFAFDSYNQLSKIAQVYEDPDIKSTWFNLKFDYKFLLQYLGCRVNNYFDCYIASVLLDFSKVRGYHKLSSVAKRYLNIDLSKTEQKSDWSGILSESQLEYAALDVLHLPALKEAMVKRIVSTSQVKAAKLEFDVIPAIAEMEMYGIPVDRLAMTSLVEKNKSILKEKEEALLRFLRTKGGKVKEKPTAYQEDIFGDIIPIKSSHDINIRSWQQLLPIFRDMGMSLESTDSKYLEPLLDKYPSLSYLLDFREIDKLCGTYGQSLLDLVSDDDRIYGEFVQFGAITSRMSGRSPNLQNQPRTYDFRSCYAPKEGRKFYISDFSQIEIRVLADFSKDSLMLQTYREGKDIHSMTGAKIFDLPYEDMKTVYKEERQSGKTANLSIMYGISPSALCSRLKSDGVKKATEEYAEMIIDGFNGIYKGAYNYLMRMEKAVMYNPELRTAAGHMIKLNFDRNDRKSVSAAKRAARNFPIQGTSANITKLAMAKVHNKLVSNYPDAHLVNVVHDELIVECSEKDAPEIKLIVDKEMKAAGEFYLRNCPVSADGGICDNWGQKG